MLNLTSLENLSPPLITAKWPLGVNVNQKRIFFKAKRASVDKLCYDWIVKV